MKVECPNCRSAYSVRDENVPLTGAKAKCPKCQQIISIKRPAQVIPAAPPKAPEEDYAKTMVLFMPMPAQMESQVKEVRAGIEGEKGRVQPGLKVSIKALDGDDAGREFALSKPCTIMGRSNADILVNDPEVSRKHAAIEIFGDKVVIKDLESTNGVFVNQLGVKLSYLKDGDLVQTGNTRFTVIIR